MTTAAGKRYKAATACIYCGKQPPEVTLTAEHVLAQGLKGDLIFPDASCGGKLSCAATTSKFERAYMRDAQDGLRTYLGVFGKRRKSERRTTIPFKTAGKTTQLRPEEYPFWAVFFDFDPPGILCGRQASGSISARLRLVAEPELHHPYIGQPFDLSGTYNATPLIRMLAKIAHSYAWAEYQIPCDFLPKIILDENHPEWSRYIGTSKTQSPFPTLHLHELGLECRAVSGRYLIICTIRLWACLPQSPTYEVVVGEHWNTSLSPRSARISIPHLQPA